MGRGNACFFQPAVERTGAADGPARGDEIGVGAGALAFITFYILYTIFLENKPKICDLIFL